MKVYAYYDLEGLKLINEKDLMSKYYKHWSDKIIKRGYKDKVTKENFIEDWLTTNWGWEVKEGEKIEKRLF